MAKTITYKKLWKLLIDKNMSRSELKTVSGVSTASIAKLGKGENITTGVLIKICESLKCDLSDIMELVDDEIPKTETVTRKVTTGQKEVKNVD